MTRITDLNDPRWLALFTDLKSSWFRLETLQHYAVDYEADEYQQFQRAGTIERQFDDWQKMIVRHVNTGRTLQRVHVIEHPRSAYIDYEIEAYKINSMAGEDIRIVDTPEGEWPDGLPRGYDYWLFDEQEVWAMEYAPDGEFVAAEQIREPDVVLRHRQWRDRAIDLAMTLHEYTERLPTYQS